MTRFLLLLATSILVALAGILLLPVAGIARASGEIAWTHGLYADKTRMANMIREPRVLVVGGSSTLFSFDADLARQRLGRPVVNFGTHAGLGLDYILARAARILRPGDIVVLVPEYELLAQSAPANEYAIQLVAFYDRDYVHELAWQDRARYLLGYNVLPSLVSGLRHMMGRPAEGRDDITLDRSGNARGNTVALSTGEALKDAKPGNLAVAPLRESRLNDFVRTAKARGSSVYVIPPALIASPAYRGADFRHFQDRLAMLYARMGMTPVGNPAQALLPQQDMYDSVYHANDRGRALYTARMLDALCGSIACP